MYPFHPPCWDLSRGDVIKRSAFTHRIKRTRRHIFTGINFLSGIPGFIQASGCETLHQSSSQQKLDRWCGVKCLFFLVHFIYIGLHVAAGLEIKSASYFPRKDRDFEHRTLGRCWCRGGKCNFPARSLPLGGCASRLTPHAGFWSSAD